MSIKLQDLAPEWNKKIEEDFSNIAKVCERQGHQLDIMNVSTCMLGEVWGWNNDYTPDGASKRPCKICDMLSQIFGEIGDMQRYLEDGDTTFIMWEIYGRPKPRKEQIDLTQNGIKRRYNNNVNKLLKHIKENHPEFIIKKNKKEMKK
jgi:hypothetical protein